MRECTVRLLLTLSCLAGISLAANSRECFSCSAMWSVCRGPFTAEQANRTGIELWNCHFNCYTRVDKNGHVYRGCFGGEYGIDPNKAGCHMQKGSYYCFCQGDKCNNQQAPSFPKHQVTSSYPKHQGAPAIPNHYSPHQNGKSSQNNGFVQHGLLPESNYYHISEKQQWKSNVEPQKPPMEKFLQRFPYNYYAKPPTAVLASHRKHDSYPGPYSHKTQANSAHHPQLQTMDNKNAYSNTFLPQETPREDSKPFSYNSPSISRPVSPPVKHHRHQHGTYTGVPFKRNFPGYYWRNSYPDVFQPVFRRMFIY